jgi:hypothetical protein
MGVGVGKAEKGSKAPKMPSGLCSAAEKLWKGTIAAWELDDVAGLAHLANAARSLTRLRRLEGILAKEGIIITGRFQQPVPNPAHKLAMVEARNFREHMRCLALDLESLYDKES